MSSDPGAPSRARVGWKGIGLVGALYGAIVALATWPRVLWFRSTLPSLNDPLEHLWIMRWSRTCLLEGRSPVLCPELQYPTGAPLGCFSPLHAQSLLYVPLSLVVANDVLCYNLLWMVGIVFTGLASFLLIREGVDDPWCAGFGGMLAMLSGPMMLHAMGHLELVYLGGLPLFLLAWMRFVDEPGRARLAGAVGLYLLLALVAAYYAVFVTFPAALYVGWTMAGRGRLACRPWLRARAGWLLAFSVAVVPGLALAFGNQIWAMARGYVLERHPAEFRIYSAPLWSYAVPTPLHSIGRLLPADPYAASGVGPNLGECGSYLGVVGLALLAYAAACRVRFPRATYWWAALALLVVLSGGASWTLLGREIPLPGLWLKRHVFLFRLIRAPARFNLVAGVVAAVVAAHGLRHLLARSSRRWVRAATFAGLTAAALADLALVPAPRVTIPAMPGCYAFMRRADPAGAFLEAPQFGSAGSRLSAVCGYWQAQHRGRTSVGYSGQANIVFDDLLSGNTPFAASLLADPGYLEDPDRVSVDLVRAVRFRDDAWLYLSAHRFRFVVLHRWPGAVPELPVRLDRLEAELAAGKVFEDEGSVVYDRERLPLPERPVVLTTGGWWPAGHGEPARMANRRARLALYSPDPRGGLQLRLDARAFRKARRVRLRAGDRELARWDVRPDAFQSLSSPTFHLPRGLHELVVESDGEEWPRSGVESSRVGDSRPYSLKVAEVQLVAVPAPAPQTARID